MKKQILKVFLCLITFSLVSVSCTKDVDFDQANDFKISPVIEFSLFHFKGTAGNFFIGGSEEATVGDFVELDIFNNEFINDNLIKAELEFEIVNSINRGYQVTVEFFDESDVLRHSFSFSADPSPLNIELLTLYTEVFEGNELLALKASTRLELTLTMLPGAPINPSAPGGIGLKSKGVFYLNIEA